MIAGWATGDSSSEELKSELELVGLVLELDLEPDLVLEDLDLEVLEDLDLEPVLELEDLDLEVLEDFDLEPELEPEPELEADLTWANTSSSYCWI